MSAVDYLVSWLRFDTSATADKSGDTWAVYGSATLDTLDGVSCVHLPSGAYLQNTSVIKLNADKWTFHCRCYRVTSSSANGFLGLGEGTSRTGIITSNDGVYVASSGGGSWQVKNTSLKFPSIANEWVHLAIIKNGSTLTFYENGQSVLTTTINGLCDNCQFLIGGNSYGKKNDLYFAEVIFYEGIALHTENFTPPTAADYDALAAEYDALGTHVVVNADVERKITNSVDITFDVERALKNKPLAWRYHNAGNTTLTVDATYLTDLPEDKSKTGVAFTQSARTRCFNLAATHDIWIKFDVYFDGANRWRAYNGGSNGVTGITAQTNGKLSYFRNNTSAGDFSNVCKTNTLQSALLHMVSGTNGLVEAWIDGTKIYTYNGDVNHGDAFSDIYLQADGAGTFFSNVIISNGEIDEGEGAELIKPSVAITVINPELEPPSQPHFNFSGTQYAVLPIMMANATTFTLEVKFSTTATQSNSYWADFPTLIGTRANLWDYNVMLGVNDGRLGFYIEKPDKLWNVPWKMCGINDGNIHKATLTVDRDAGTISLTCDGYTLTYEGRTQINPNFNLQIAKVYGITYLPCNIYEARVWSTVREGWEDINGTEAGLECWLLPTPDGLLDYSGNDRHATLYGDPLYVGEEPFYFDVERNLINVVTATAAIERRVKNGGEFTFAVERKIIQPVATTAAIERLIQKSVEVAFAVERELISPFVDIDFVIQRRVTKSEQLTFDVARRVVHINRLAFAVKRKVINALTLNFDLEMRQVVNTTEINFDVERNVVYVEENRFAVECDILIDGLLTKILPESILRDPKMYASAVALDQQLIKTFTDVRNILHIPRLEELSGTILDLLNWQYHTDFYEPLHLSDDIKRNLIRQSVGWHRIKGTKAAVEYLCEAAFRQATVEEWFEYGGAPYTFRVVTKGFASTPDGFDTYKRLINSAKSIRSHLDGILVDYSPEKPLAISVGIARLRIGTRKFHHDKPASVNMNFSVGAARVKAGTKKILHHKPQDFNCKIFVGSVRTRVGKIIIGDIPPPDPPTIKYRLPLITFSARSRAGFIRIVHKEQGAADIDDPFPLDDDDTLPSDFVGSYGWFRFYAPSGKRGIKFRNAREDVTEAELKAVADYIIDNKILLNSKGDALQYCVRASVVRTYEEDIPLNVIDKVDTLPKIKELPYG